MVGNFAKIRKSAENPFASALFHHFWNLHTCPTDLMISGAEKCDFAHFYEKVRIFTKSALFYENKSLVAQHAPAGAFFSQKKSIFAKQS